MKAAIYCRVSTEGQEQDGTSLQTQLEACQKYCQWKGYEVVYQLIEAWLGLSLERPKLAGLSKECYQKVKQLILEGRNIGNLRGKVRTALANELAEIDSVLKSILA